MSITHQIKIIQLNIKSARANKSLLDHYINKQKKRQSYYPKRG